MKSSLYIHRNPHARGFGLSIHKEGILIVEFRLWHLSGSFYAGKRTFADDVWRKRVDELEAKIQSLEQAALTT